jgi:hypothetical protein
LPYLVVAFWRCLRHAADYPHSAAASEKRTLPNPQWLLQSEAVSRLVIEDNFSLVLRSALMQALHQSADLVLTLDPGTKTSS